MSEWEIVKYIIPRAIGWFVVLCIAMTVFGGWPG